MTSISIGQEAIFDVTEIFNGESFESAAQEIFSACKALLGASCGYLALLSENGTENRALYLEAGEFPCGLNPSMPMPVRGLRQEVYRTGNAIYENSFTTSRWKEVVPTGHSLIKNVLFAPVTMDGTVIGLIGLANKAGEFTDFDAKVATSFGKLAAVTFKNISVMEKLRTQEEHFHSVFDTANDAIIGINIRGEIVYWNNAAQRTFGYLNSEVVGKSVNLIIPYPLHNKHQKAIQNAAGKEKVRFSTEEVNGIRKDGTVFPLEISVATWISNKEHYFTGILRDITERKAT